MGHLNSIDGLNDMHMQAETLETVLNAAQRMASTDEELSKLLGHAISLVQMLANDLDVAAEQADIKKAA